MIIVKDGNPESVKVNVRKGETMNNEVFEPQEITEGEGVLQTEDQAVEQPEQDEEK